MNIVQKQTYISEKEYRALKDKLSYSALKTFDDNRIKFYKKFILGESVDEPMSNDMINGSLVDCILFTPLEFDKKFLIAAANKPTGQMGELCDYLIHITSKASKRDNEDEEYSEIEITREFSDMFQEAFDKCQREGKFKGKDLSKVLDLFQADAETYYEEGRNAIGKILVTADQVNYAQKLADDALNSPYEAGDILRLESSEHVEVINQLPIITDFGHLFDDTYDVEIPFKSMLDKVVINHITKTIHKFDLKVTWEAEEFHYNFLKLKYYLQLGTYDTAFEKWVKTERKDLKGYKIEPLHFIVIDSKGVSSPLVYKTSKEWSNAALEGWTTPTGREYRGIKTLIHEIQHHLSTGNWTISKENYKNNGTVNLKELWV